MSIITLCLAWYQYASSGLRPAWASPARIILEVGNLTLTTLLVSTVGGLKLAQPSVLARLPHTAPDDLVSLSSWLMFRWINAFIAYGYSRELEPEDLPQLSLQMQTAICFQRFREVKAKSLLWKVLKANRLDMILDCVLTIVSVVMNYAAPFFLKRILDGLPQGATRALPQAYVYTFLALLATVIKVRLSSLFQSVTAADYRPSLIFFISGTAVVPLFASRQSSLLPSTTRLSSVATPRVSSLPRRMRRMRRTRINPRRIPRRRRGRPTPIRAKWSTSWLAMPPGGSPYYDYADDQNSEHGVWCLLALLEPFRDHHCRDLPLQVSFSIPQKPELTISLLGWSAFAGVIVLAIAAPLNSYVSKRSIKIYQDLLKARDKRITVMNELIGAITFIKVSCEPSQSKLTISSSLGPSSGKPGPSMRGRKSSSSLSDVCS